MFNASPQSFTSPQAPSTSPAPPQAFSSPQQPSPYPPPASPPQFAPPAPLQGGFFGGMNQPSTPGYNPRPPGMMPAPARAAQDMQGYGRGNDTMLMHVTPGEVQGLQALAQRHGGSLTTNPHTGLPEAGFLEDILPTLLGGALTFLSGGALSPLMAAGLVGGGTTLATGSLEKGLMAGLGAFGGGSLGSAVSGLGAGAGAGATSAANTVLPATLPEAVTTGITAAPAPANMAALLPSAPTSLTAPAAVSPATSAAARAVVPAPIASGATGIGTGPSISQLAAQKLGADIPTAAAVEPGLLENVFGRTGARTVKDFGGNFAQAASGGDKISPMRTGIAALGASAPFLQAMQPTYEPYKKEDDYNYEGPYLPTQRTPRFRGPNANLGDSSEFSYFDNTNPYPGFGPAPKAFAEGGEVARTEDRALRMPAAGYQAGMGAEHNYNFRPVNPAPSMQMGMPAAPARTTGRQSFADMISTSKSKGKGADDASSAPNMRKYRYDPRTQSVLEDGSYGGMEGMGMLGGLDGLNIGGFAAGGDVNLRDGSFVVDARTVSELGNGSSGAGQELLARHGGQPIRGPGDGVSDSIPANIGGRQRAKVARDEVKFDPEAVRRLGGGDLQRGAQKLYALMEKAQKARKAAGRGQDTKLRKKL